MKCWIFSGFSCKNSMKICALKVITKMGVSLTRLNIIKLKYSNKFKRLVNRWILAWVILVNKTSNSKQKYFFFMWNIEAFSYHKNAHKNDFLITRTINTYTYMYNFDFNSSFYTKCFSAFNTEKLFATKTKIWIVAYNKFIIKF